VDDAIFRMTRERTVLVLADVGRAAAADVVERLLSDFRARYPMAIPLEVRCGYFELAPDERDASVKRILPAVFNGLPN
jgi:hypothetical protein